MILLSDILHRLTSCTEWLAIASLKTIPLIICVLLLQRIFRNYLAAASRHLLWLSVLLSLSFPFGWHINMGALIANPSALIISESNQGTASVSQYNLAAVKIKDATTSTEKITQPQHEIGEPLGAEANRFSVISKQYSRFFAIFWLLGTMVLLGITLTRARYFQRIKANAITASPTAVALFTACKLDMKINTSIELLCTHNIQSPITVGWFRPAIFLPNNIEQQLTPENLKHVLFHELGHIQRHDILFNWMVCLINIVHWFNPAVWLACRRMKMDMEIACDACVLTHLQQSQRKHYGATLIEISGTSRTSHRAITTLGILENHTELKERLHMIKEFTTMNIKNTMLFGVILMATTITSLAQPTAQSTDQPATHSSEMPATKSDMPTSEAPGTLRDFAAYAEKDLKIKVLVGQDDGNRKIQFNIGKEALTYGQLLTQLKINEFTAYKSKDYIQIVSMRDARNLSIPTVEKGKSYYEDEVVTDYLKAKKACAAKVLAALRPLVPQYAHLSAFEGANTLIITDTYGNIQRIKTLMQALEDNLDKPEDCSKQPESRPAAPSLVQPQIVQPQIVQPQK
jgi:beta-lactamase regulating signal transducer with metallopeptidase domain